MEWWMGSVTRAFLAFLELHPDGETVFALDDYRVRERGIPSIWG